MENNLIIPKILNIESFFRRISVDQGTKCWNWTGSLNQKKYGQFNVIINGVSRGVKAHRVSYSIFKKDIEPGMTIDHRCKNRKCVNPDHLEEVTRAHNTLNNSDSITAKNKRKTHCMRGHELFGGNLRIDSRGNRACFKCAQVHRQKYKAQRKVELK